jgi:predicted transcriptional regulator
MAMTLRLTDEQAEALRRRANAEHRSMQQVVLAAIDAYVSQLVSPPQRREAVQVAELLDAFADLPPMDVDAFRAAQDRQVDSAAHFDAYERARE